ncbi:TIGR02300 family protein [Tistlia consotensis]|uniref:TIGR02300 family protein n=1 Tax=Tistlia consotensis USBA 355 TaxID=560819 RepID=A0A1Y6B9E1_9PROT|nr:TIGR02300 family protein [Tistlia consotensis]SME92567.1 TIGR02300 family protein [Tistlia consotensis USBA 355]SNR28099.1 TIGR02300 family protein [Tistlia consotensis]
MAKPEWGSKRICQSCGAKFYDLGKDPIVCPACGATFDPEAVLKSRRGKPLAPKEKPRPTKSKVDEARDAAIMDDDELELDDEAEADESDDDMVEDTADLGDDDDIEVDVADDDKED